MLLARFRPYLSALPTVGRFALGPPHNVQLRVKIKVPLRYNRIRSRSARSPRGQVFGLYRSEAFVFAPARFLDFARNDGTKYRSVLFYNVICKCGHRRLAYGGSPFAPARSLRLRASRSALDDKGKYRFARFYNVICKCGHRRLAYGGSPFAPALVSTSLKMTEAKYRSARLAAGRGRPALPKRYYARQKFCRTQTKYPWADEERPYLSSQSLILPLLKCHFDRSVSVVDKFPAEVTR